MNKNFSGDVMEFGKEDDAIKWYKEKFENSHLSRNDRDFLNKITDTKDMTLFIFGEYLISHNGELLE